MSRGRAKYESLGHSGNDNRWRATYKYANVFYGPDCKHHHKVHSPVNRHDSQSYISILKSFGACAYHNFHNSTSTNTADLVFLGLLGGLGVSEPGGTGGRGTGFAIVFVL
jgi:hypothetical protein